MPPDAAADDPADLAPRDDAAGHVAPGADGLGADTDEVAGLAGGSDDVVGRAPDGSDDDLGGGAPDPVGRASEGRAVEDAKRAIEAILMVAEEPIEPQLLAQLVELPTQRVESLCQELAGSYEAEGRGFALARVAGGYRFQSHADLAPYVERFVLVGQTSRLSAAALETMAIVAYKQPLSRAQVAAIRGVNVDGVMRTLQHRGYIEEVARDSGPGQALLFGTTRLFLERLGLDSLDQLPALGEFVPGADVVEALELGLRADDVRDVPAHLGPDQLSTDALDTDALDTSRLDAEGGDRAAAGEAADDGVVIDLDRLAVAGNGNGASPLDEGAHDGDVIDLDDERTWS